MNRHELSRRETVFLQALTQGGVVLQDTQLLSAFCLIDSDTHRCVRVRIAVHIIGVVSAERGRVGAHRFRELHLHPFGINLINGPLGRTLLRRLIINGLRLLIDTNKTGHVPVTLCHLTLHHTGRRVKIDVRVAILLAHIGKAILQKMDRGEPFRVNIALVLVAQDQP